MTEKMLSARLQQKTDTSENWEKATTFVPKKGEMIIYSDLKQFKVGDGVTLLSALDFFTQEQFKNFVAGNNITITETDNEIIISASGGGSPEGPINGGTW